MPHYDYRCPACEHREKDIFQKMNDPAIECPKCGAQMERCLGPGRFILSGKRWEKKKGY